MSLIESIDSRIRALSEAHAPLLEGMRAALMNVLMEFRAEVLKRDAENERARAALARARECIRAWHNMDLRNQSDSEREATWALYQESPEMRQINAALSTIKEPR